MVHFMSFVQFCIISVNTGEYPENSLCACMLFFIIPQHEIMYVHEKSKEFKLSWGDTSVGTV